MKSLSLILFLCCTSVVAQTEDQNAVRASVDAFFAGMKTQDTLAIRKVLHPTAFLKSIVKTKTGEIKLVEESMTQFLKSVYSLQGKKLDERLLSYDIKIDGAMAVAWTPYEFYFEGTFSHCGVNVFSLINTEQGWKIIGIVDTRRKQGCK